jgi:hypothetical protein
MSFDFENGFECENCGETIGGGLYDFYESKELMEQEEWISKRVNGEWLNFCCRKCLEEYRRNYERNN